MKSIFDLTGKKVRIEWDSEKELRAIQHYVMFLHGKFKKQKKLL